jgi:hypothetical protein
MVLRQSWWRHADCGGGDRITDAYPERAWDEYVKDEILPATAMRATRPRRR